jgi:hypothetical protein
MDGHDEDRPSPSTAVPDLIERFRLRRDAWIAQADELARLRDEVRGSAEREAMEVVTSARRDVRQVVMEARRELLVLSAQVQAALGEVSSKPDPTVLLHKVGIDAGEFPAAEAAAQPIDAGFAPEAAIEKILNEVQADMTALADEARTLPGRAVGAPDASPAALPPAETSAWADELTSWAPPGPSDMVSVDPPRDSGGAGVSDAWAEPAEQPDSPERASAERDTPGPAQAPLAEPAPAAVTSPVPDWRDVLAARDAGTPSRPVPVEPPSRPTEPESRATTEPEPAALRLTPRVGQEPTETGGLPAETPGAPPAPGAADVDAAPAASPHAPYSVIRERLDRLVTSTAPARPPSQEAEAAGPVSAPDSRTAAVRRAIGLSEAASKALLSSPLSSESVPVPSGRSLWTFVALFAAIGLIVVMATTWWLGGGEEAPAAELIAEATEPAAPDPGEGSVTGVEAPADSVPEPEPSSPPLPPPGGPGNLWVAGEALREVWVRTTVDGRADQGRTLAQGETLSVTADRTIALRVGDAGALLVSVDDGAWRPLGVDGEVVTRQFEAGVTDTAASSPAAAPRAERFAPGAPPSASSSAGAAFRPGLTPVAAPAASSPSAPRSPESSVDLRAPAPRPIVAAASVPAAGGAVTVGGGDPAGAPGSRVGDVRAAESEVLAAAERWLEAYHREDRATMARLSAENLLLADERSADERFPPGLSDVQRKLDGVRVQISADMAVLTAVMTERSGSSTTARVSPVSQIWVLGEGEWKVRQARFVSEARLNQVLR